MLPRCDGERHECIQAVPLPARDADHRAHEGVVGLAAEAWPNKAGEEAAQSSLLFWVAWPLCPVWPLSSVAGPGASWGCTVWVRSACLPQHPLHTPVFLTLFLLSAPQARALRTVLSARCPLQVAVPPGGGVFLPICFLLVVPCFSLSQLPFLCKVSTPHGLSSFLRSSPLVLLTHQL